MNRKAMFYTVSAVLVMALVLLALKVVIDARTAGMRPVGVADAFDRMADIHDSLGNVLASTVREEAGIGLSGDNDTVTFSEALPNTHVGTFRTRIDEIKRFVEDPFVTVVVDGVKADPVLKLMPHNISYGHMTYGDDIAIAYPDEAPTSFDVSIATDEVIVCSWSFTPGIVPVHVDASGTNSSCDDTHAIDPAQPARFSINGGALVVSVGERNMTTTSSISATVTTSLGLSDHGAPQVIYPSTLIRIEVPYANITREDGVRIW